MGLRIGIEFRFIEVELDIDPETEPSDANGMA